MNSPKSSALSMVAVTLSTVRALLEMVRPAPVRSVNLSLLMVKEPTAWLSVVVALPLMVVEPTDTNPALKVRVVEVALLGNGFQHNF